MIKFLRKKWRLAFSITAIFFSIFPERLFNIYTFIEQDTIERYLHTINYQDINIGICKILCISVLFIISAVISYISKLYKNSILIEFDNCYINVEYGDIFKTLNCKRVINFDECFTTQIGDAIDDIKADSICGQYLTTHMGLDVQNLIKKFNIAPAANRSRYKNLVCYESGTIVPNGNDLLMAFAKLDEKGKGRFFSRDEYLECLNKLWQELECYYAQKDVCIPILGSGITSFDGWSGVSISQQELLNTIICSYKLSSHKIKYPYKLRIICREDKNFTFDKIVYN